MAVFDRRQIPPPLSHNPNNQIAFDKPTAFIKGAADGADRFFEMIIEGIKRLTGIDLSLLSGILSGKWNLIEGLQGAVSAVQNVVSGVQTALAALQDKVENIPVLGDFFELVTGKPDSDPNDAASWIRNALDAIGKAATGASNPASGDSFLTNIFNAITGVRNTATGADTKATAAQGTANAAQTAAGAANALANAATSAANNALSGVTQVAKSIFDTWFGGSTAAGTPAEVQQAIEAIKQAVINGYTVDTITASGSYAKPSESTRELVVAGMGGGSSGAFGSNGTTSAGGVRGLGGLNGGYLVLRLNPDAITWPVPVTIGTNGNDTLFGSYLTTVSGAGGIQSDFGYQATSSTPGNGGAGGTGGYKAGTQANYGTAGSIGIASAAANGGSGGSATSLPAGAGAAGQSVSAGVAIKCGGAGGGGGGGGGGGAGFSSGSQGAGGAPGPGATGVLWVFWK